MILIKRICVPDVPLKVFFLHIFVHIVFLNFKFTAVKLLLIMHLAFQISRLYFFSCRKYLLKDKIDVLCKLMNFYFFPNLKTYLNTVHICHWF